MSGVPAHGNLKQNCCEFGANLGYRVGISQRKQNCCKLRLTWPTEGYISKQKEKREKREREEGRRTGEIASSVWIPRIHINAGWAFKPTLKSKA